METVFGIPYSSEVTILACTFKMRCGPDLRCWSLLYVLRAKSSADVSNVVAKDSLLMKT